MEIVGFVDEERLNGMFLSRDITELDYVKHHSQGMLDAYFSFIADNNLPDNNTSATKFLEEENVSYGNEEDEGNDNQQEEVDVPSYVDIYRKWVDENEKVNILLTGCEEAAIVTLWRYNNPTASKTDCAVQTHLLEDKVIEWWDTIDFVKGAMGDGHFSLMNPTLANIKELIFDAANQSCME